MQKLADLVCPAICSRAVGASDDLLEDEVNGLLVDPGDPTALVEAMLNIERRAPELVAMGEVSRTKAAPYKADAWAHMFRSFAEVLPARVGAAATS